MSPFILDRPVANRKIESVLGMDAFIYPPRDYPSGFGIHLDEGLGKRPHSLRSWIALLILSLTHQRHTRSLAVGEVGSILA